MSVGKEEINAPYAVVLTAREGYATGLKQEAGRPRSSSAQEHLVRKLGARGRISSQHELTWRKIHLPDTVDATYVYFYVSTQIFVQPQARQDPCSLTPAKTGLSETHGPARRGGMGCRCQMIWGLSARPPTSVHRRKPIPL